MKVEHRSAVSPNGCISRARESCLSFWYAYQRYMILCVMLCFHVQPNKVVLLYSHIHLCVCLRKSILEINSSFWNEQKHWCIYVSSELLLLKLIWFVMMHVYYLDVSIDEIGFQLLMRFECNSRAWYKLVKF